MIKNISNSHPNVFIENKQIKQVYECKTYGVKIDQHFTSKGNTDEICKKVAVGISDIRWIKPFVHQDTPIKIYNAIVRPYFDYCALKYGMYLVKLNQNDCKNCKIEQLVLIILNVNNDVEPTIALRALGWEPLQTERKKKPKQKLCTSYQTKWVQNHSQIYFRIRVRKQIITFVTFLVVFAYQNHAQIIWRI